jgi:DNA-binding transcriptional ArsR family regulator
VSRRNSSAEAKLSPIAADARALLESRMVAAANLVEVAALVGDTARATMLAALMGGQSLTGTELAFIARVSRPTASGHLAKLVSARLVTVTRKRRFSYYRIASPLVAAMLESIKVVAAIEVPRRHQPRSPLEAALRFARSCYDHLAGHAGVALTDALVAHGHLILTDEGGEITPSGERLLRGFGAELKPPAKSRRLFCQPCLDWSERRYHVKGHVGAEILRCCLARDWFRRSRDGRALHLTPAGEAGFAETFGVTFADRPSRHAPAPAVALRL